MGRTDGNVDSFARVYSDLFPIESHSRSAFDHEPVLSSLSMFLAAESLSGQEFDTLTLEITIFLKDCVSSPRSAIKFPQDDVPPQREERTLAHKKTQRF